VNYSFKKVTRLRVGVNEWSAVFIGLQATKITKKCWYLGNITTFDILIQHRINTKTTQYHTMQKQLYMTLHFHCKLLNTNSV